jgi:hypothetical protein
MEDHHDLGNGTAKVRGMRCEAPYTGRQQRVTSIGNSGNTKQIMGYVNRTP